LTGSKSQLGPSTDFLLIAHGFGNEILAESFDFGKSNFEDNFTGSGRTTFNADNSFSFSCFTSNAV